MSVSLTFESGVSTVTGANFLLALERSNILIDCGLIQGSADASITNRQKFSYNPEDIDFLFITHAHLDHVGRIPKLVNDGFKGVIYSTPETKALARLILDDAVTILDKEARRDGVLPLYESVHIEEAFSLWQEIPYHEHRQINDELEVYLYDAGHILGSAMIECTITKGDGTKKILFTGDLGNSPTPLLRDTEAVEHVDYLIMESVYGDRNHEPKDMRRKKLQTIIHDTVKRGGALIIPAFSLERTQVILYELNNLVEHNLIPSVPIFVDSPLATKVTEIYRNSGMLFNEKVKEEISNGDDIFNFPRLKFTMNRYDSQKIYNMPNPKIILAGSGMSVGGRVVNHEAHFLPDPRSTILLVGYQTLGTLGRTLQDGAKKVLINEEHVPVKAHIETILGYSSHKDSDHLVEFVEGMGNKIQKVFVVMGEPKAALFLVQKLRDNLGVDALYPKRGEKYEL